MTRSRWLPFVAFLAIAALLVVVAVTWVMRKLRGSKSTERLPR